MPADQIRTDESETPRLSQAHRSAKATPTTPRSKRRLDLAATHSKRRARKRLDYDEPSDDAELGNEKVPSGESTPAAICDDVSKRLHDDCKLSAISGWSKAEIHAKSQRLKASRREASRRKIAAVDKEEKRAQMYHEVPGRFEAEKFLRIRRDVSFNMMCEQIERSDRAAGREPRKITRESFD